uniref:Uncharacterized protein n=1 Tax=Siphoviridae sp. ct5co22 TaxID=2826294 RepID=A0A8S5QU73_9CAUD|nr:MAG TPA: hypothetical protein [Siphoviridae sp. ct5co22]
MTIIEIQPQSNGAHRNQTVSGAVTIPGGWAVIPADTAIPETFPFVDLVVEGQHVVSMTAGVVPEPEPEPEPEPTETEQLRADIDFIAAMTGVSL